MRQQKLNEVAKLLTTDKDRNVLAHVARGDFAGYFNAQPACHAALQYKEHILIDKIKTAIDAGFFNGERVSTIRQMVGYGFS